MTLHSDAPCPVGQPGRVYCRECRQRRDERIAAGRPINWTGDATTYGPRCAPYLEPVPLWRWALQQVERGLTWQQIGDVLGLQSIHQEDADAVGDDGPRRPV